MRLNSFTWRHMWCPFNVTRNQVEFRVFNMLFLKAYQIGTFKDQFNFGYYLRLSHQQNVISFIDMIPAKWFTVVMLTNFLKEFDLFLSLHK
jgi:hypothetical protein